MDLLSFFGCWCGPSFWAAIWSCCSKSSSICSVMRIWSGWWKALWIVFLIIVLFLSALIWRDCPRLGHGRASAWLRRDHGRSPTCRRPSSTCSARPIRSPSAQTLLDQGAITPAGRSLTSLAESACGILMTTPGCAADPSSSAERRPRSTARAPSGVSRGPDLGWPSDGPRSRASTFFIVNRQVRLMRP